MAHDKSSKKNRTPRPVLHAQRALEELRREEPALADAVAKVLPGYAVRRAQAGEDVTVETLVRDARQGSHFLKNVFKTAATANSFLDSYQKIRDGHNPTVTKGALENISLFVAGHNNATLHLQTDPETGFPLEQDVIALLLKYPPSRDMYRVERWEMRDERPYHQYADAAALTFKSNVKALYRALDQNDGSAIAQALLGALTPYQYSLHYKTVELLLIDKFVRQLLNQGRLDAVLPALTILEKKWNLNLYPAHKILSALPKDYNKADAIERIVANGARYDYAERDFILPILQLFSPERALELIRESHPWNDNVWAKVFDLCLTSGRTDMAVSLAKKAPFITVPRLYVRELAEHLLSHGNRDIYKAYKHLFSWSAAEWLENSRTIPLELLRHLAKEAGKDFTPELIRTLILRNVTNPTVLAWLTEQLPQGQLTPEIIQSAIQPATLYRFLAHPSPAEDYFQFMDFLANQPALAQCDHVRIAVTILNERHTPTYIKHSVTLLRKLALSDEDVKTIISRLEPNAFYYSDAIETLLGWDNMPNALRNKLLQSAINPNANPSRRYRLVDQLIQGGADPALLPPEHTMGLRNYRLALENWQRIARQKPPQGLSARDPRPFKPKLFADVTDALETEGYLRNDSGTYAYNAVALFQSPERVLQYLKKWGQAGPQPLHNLLQVCTLPSGDLSAVDLNAWGDAILRYGPEMAKLAKFCIRIPQPVKSESGEWSLAKTRELAAQFTYVRGHEHPALSALCNAQKVSEQSFERALQVVQSTVHTEKNIPEIVISGARFDLPGTTFRRLAANDVRGLFLGQLTDCCQSIGGAGDKCAEHGFTSPDGGFYVIETDKGEVIGQSWAWRGTEGDLCLDSLEKLGNRVSAEQWKKLVLALSDELAKRKHSDITALHVGTSGETPRSFAQSFRTAANKKTAGNSYYTIADHHDDKALVAAVPRDYNGYRDSNNQYVVWQRSTDNTVKSNKKTHKNK